MCCLSPTGSLSCFVPQRGLGGSHDKIIRQVFSQIPPPPEIKGADYLMVLKATGDGWMDGWVYFTDPKKGKYCVAAWGE